MQRQFLAACWRKRRHRAFAQNLGAVAVGDNEADIARNDLARKFRRHREIEAVAEIEILLPLRIRLVVDEARLDFEDDDLAFRAERDDVDAAAGGERSSVIAA